MSSVDPRKDSPLNDVLADITSFICISRVCAELMPREWQERLKALLEEYNGAHPNWPEDWRVRVKLYKGRKMIAMPDWLLEHGSGEEIKKVKGET